MCDPQEDYCDDDDVAAALRAEDELNSQVDASGKPDLIVSASARDSTIIQEMIKKQRRRIEERLRQED